MYIGSTIGIGFFLNNEYRMEKFDIGTPLASCTILAAATHNSNKTLVRITTHVTSFA